MNQMDYKQCREMILYVAQKIVESEPYLTEIDMEIGDGDHGTGMKRGFSNVMKTLKERCPESMEEVFRVTGWTLLDTMGGASGVLFGTVFISGISKRDNHLFWNLEDFSQVFNRSLLALKERGKAKVGDKTMVDALEPAAEALGLAAAKGKGLKEGFSQAAECAGKGVEYSKNVKARFGRAKYFGEKAIGLQDAGATSVWIIFRSMSQWIEENI